MLTFVRAKDSDVWHWRNCHLRPKPENIEKRVTQERRPSGDACNACLALDRPRG